MARKRRRRYGIRARSSLNERMLTVIAALGVFALGGTLWRDIFSFVESAVLDVTSFFTSFIGVALVASVLALIVYMAARPVHKLLRRYQYDQENDVSFQFYREVAQTDNMPHAQFEHFVGYLLRHDGYTDVDVTPPVNDEGIDLFVKKDGKQIAVQVKHYKVGNNVGRPAVQEFWGAFHGVTEEGLLVTSSTFTPAARLYARKKGKTLRLLNRADLGEMIARLPNANWKHEYLAKPSAKPTNFDSV